ncbi:MAG: ribonuclease / adenosylcobalamin/alpha-ribazole phosphatase [Pseudonocardiales bacterium]|nr:ribonuclease / adenosylcobalamin/alpha-ribazole phosphatase [Pseudonocardiales bacterium]
MTGAVIVEADGGSRGNPGPAGYGAVVLDADTRAVLVERAEPIGIGTNNVAEYRGLLAGLAAARELGARRVAVRMDSKLVVEQMKGAWKIKHPAMRELAREAADLLAHFEDVTFEWIPRAQNAHADRLANEAMDRAAGKIIRPAPAPPPGSGAGAPMTRTWTRPTARATRLVLVRHGSTAHSAEQRFSGRNDLPLNDVGEQQAAALAARSYGTVAAMVSSPLLRTVQTAEIIAAPLGLAVETVDDLVETDFGAWEGLTFAEARALDAAKLDAWLASPDVAPPEGESFAAVARRVRRGRETVLAAYPGSTVVVVTHVTPIKTLVRLTLDAPPSAMFRLHLDTASVSIIDYYADGNSSVQLVNDTGHLG